MTDDASNSFQGAPLDDHRGAVSLKSQPGLFFVKPHLQVGSGDNQLRSLTVAFNVYPDRAKWRVQYKRTDKKKWREAHLSKPVTLPVARVLDSVRYLATLPDLSPGCLYLYRLLRDEEVVFSSSAVSPKKKAQAVKFAVFGDIADGTPASRRLAYSVYNAAPDLVVFAGDLVYEDGRVSEYIDKFFPVYNAETASPDTGAPLLRSVLSAAALGNHDARWPEDSRVVPAGRVPDALGYFHFWNQMDNGPALTREQLGTFNGGKKKRKRLAWLLGKKFMRRSNFSFDYGAVHWLILDGNSHADWSSSYLRDWVEADLKASSALWKFVCIHQPPFTHDPVYRVEQSIRHLCDIFQDNAVDIVFSGHTHAYERHHPLRFFRSDVTAGGDSDRVDGDLEIDRSFDGINNTRPNGVLYIVSGAGEPSEQAKGDAPAFLSRRIEGKRSFTLCDVRGNAVVLRQVAEDGQEIEQLTITK